MSSPSLSVYHVSALMFTPSTTTAFQLEILQLFCSSSAITKIEPSPPFAFTHFPLATDNPFSPVDDFPRLVAAPQSPAVAAPQYPAVAAPQFPAVAAPQYPAVAAPQSPAVAAPLSPAVAAP